MFYQAAGGAVKIGATDMDYITFGYGKKALVMLPGLGDALKTVKGTAIPFAMMYKLFAKDYKVYVFSRKNQLPDTYSIREMAHDQAQALRLLNIEAACVMGISQGGMIAQHLAIDFPQLVEKLVLAVTVSQPNETIQPVVQRWLCMARANDYRQLFIDTAEKSYSEKRLKQYRMLYPLLARISKPKTLERFITQATACLAHNAYNELEAIRCPTLVIGGEADAIAGAAASQEIAAKIKGAD